MSEGFTGRGWVFEKIDHWLKHDEERFSIITGKPGVGKSAIITHFIQTHKNIVAYYFCQVTDSEEMKPGRVLRSLMVQLGKTLPHYGLALVNTIKPVHYDILALIFPFS